MCCDNLSVSRLWMFGDCDHAGTGIDCGGDGEIGVEAGLLLWIQIRSMPCLNVFEKIYDSSYHMSFIMLSVNATDQGTQIRWGF